MEGAGSLLVYVTAQKAIQTRLGGAFPILTVLIQTLPQPKLTL